MEKTTIFLVPGFKEQISDKAYKELEKLLTASGFRVKTVPVHWNYRVMTDYLEQFEAYFEKHKGEKNYILGFSYGAMIALLSAKRTKPNKLFLCSLSPYFAEDMKTMPEKWKRFIGKRRVKDFFLYKAKEAVNNVSVPTYLFLGEKEAEKFPSLKKRCMATYKQMSRTKLIIIADAPHDIGNKHYQESIKQHVV